MKKVQNLLLLALSVCSFSLRLVAEGGKLLTHKLPVYPLAAKAAGVEGSVILKGTITTGRKMENVQVISGPRELRQAAVDAVSTWTYEPYKHFRHIVTVDTTMTLNFLIAKDAAGKAEAQAKAKAELAAQQDSTPKQ